MSGSLGKIIEENTLHIKNIGSYTNAFSNKSIEE
jgi:archaellum component FlaG (FlaF/FlaG flagellin family)